MQQIHWFKIFCRMHGKAVMLTITRSSHMSLINEIAKSNKSEICNRLSHKGLHYHFKVRSQTLRNNCKISRSQPQYSTSIVIWPQRPRRAQVRVKKECHWIILPSNTHQWKPHPWSEPRTQYIMSVPLKSTNLLGSILSLQLRIELNLWGWWNSCDIRFHMDVFNQIINFQILDTHFSI